MEKSAVISKCGKYRYLLSRVWDKKKGLITFTGLNPSTADAKIDDRTVLKCIMHAKRFGAGGFLMVNEFAFRSTDPNKLKKITGALIKVVGPENDRYIKEANERASIRVVMWGAMGRLNNRDREVIDLIPRPIFCFGLTQEGMPRHPLYMKNDTKLMVYAV